MAENGNDDPTAAGDSPGSAEAAKPARGPGRPFQPGNTLGKRGRPKESARAKAILVKGSEKAAAELVRLAEKARSEAVRERACRDVLAYVLPPGKTLLELTGAPPSQGGRSDNPLMQLLERLRVRRDGGAPPPEGPGDPPTKNGPPAEAGAAEGRLS